MTNDIEKFDSSKLMALIGLMTEPYRHFASATAMEISRREAESTDDKSIVREIASAPRLRLDPTDNPQTYTIIRLPESFVGVYSSPSKEHHRYEGRQFPNGYNKRKKAKAKQQKQNRRKNRR